MVLCIPTHSHFNPLPVSPPIFHSFHTSSSSSFPSSAPTFLLALPRHPSLNFILPSAPPLLLLLPGAAITHTLIMDLCCRSVFPAGALALLVFLFRELVRPPEKSWNVSAWSAPYSGSVLFSMMSEDNFPFACQSSCLQLSVHVFLSRTEALRFPLSWETRAQPCTDSLSGGSVDQLLAASRMFVN